MRPPRPSRPWMATLAAVIAVVGAAGLYYQLRIRSNRSYLTQRNFRVLAVAGRQFTAAIESIFRMMEADLDAAFRDAGKGTWDDRCGKPQWPEGCGQRDILAGSCAAAWELKQRLQLRRCLVNDDSGGQAALPQVDFEDYVLAATPAVKPSTLGKPPPPAQLTLRHGEPAELAVRRTAGKDDLTALGNARANLQAILEPFLVPGVFDSVLLLDHDGRVLVTAVADLRVSRLGFAADAGEAEGSGKAGKEKAAAETRAGKAGVPHVERLELGGRDYLAFCQPLEITEATPAVSALCGLSAAARFDAESVALNPYVFVGLAAFLILGVMSWPLLKVAFVGAGERVRVFDLVWLGLSVLVSTGLLALLSLDLAAYWGEMPPVTRSREERGALDKAASAWQVDDHLERLADEISASFEAELHDARKSLQLLARVPHKVLMANPDLAGWKPGEESPAGVKLPYPILHTATWIDAGGRQVVKWTTTDVPAPPNPVGDRTYFINAKNDRLWRDREGSFFAEVVRSRSNGAPLLLLSTQAKADVGVGPDGSDPLVVVALASRAVSAIGSILPPGYGFALLDSDGRTLLHSEDRHALEEDFIEETDGNPALRALVLARTAALLDVQYWGQPHRLYARPLESMPWTLAVFYESDIARTAHLEALTLAFSLLIGLLLLLGLWVVFTRLFTGAGREPWLWPQRGATARYGGLALLFVATGLVVLVTPKETVLPVILLPLAAAGLAAAVLPSGVRVFRRVGVAAFFAGVPLLLLAVGALTLGERVAAFLLGLAAIGLVRRPGAVAGPWVRWGIAPRAAYMAWAMAALFAFAVAPAASFYRLAWDRYTRLYLQHAMLEMARRLDRHPFTPKPGLESPDDKPGFRGPYQFFYGGGLVDPPATAGECGLGAAVDPLETPGVLVPLYNSHSVHLRGLGAASAAGWKARRREGALCLEFEREQGGQNFRFLSHAATPVPRGRYFAPLGLLLTGVGAGALLLFLTRRLFMLDFKDPETVSLHSLATEPIRTDLLVICPPLGRKERLLARDDLLLVDLQASDRKPADLRALLEGHPRPQILCFDRFEVAVQDATQRSALLAGLEQAVALPGSPLVLLSETDPEAALGLEDARRVPEGSLEAENRRRWAQLLGRFVRVVAVDPGEPEEFAADLLQAEKEAQSRLGGQVPDSHIREAFATLRRECLSQHALQAIGRVMVNLPDFPYYDRDRVVRHVRELADSYYRGLWFSLGDAEKLLLHQIAAGDLVNPRSGRALSRLLALRLVVREVSFRVATQSFTRFVVSVTTPDDVLAWQRSRTAGVWESLRTPVLIGLLSGCAFLAYSERETVTGLVASVTAVIPLLAKLLDLLRPQKAPAEAA